MFGSERTGAAIALSGQTVDEAALAMQRNGGDDAVLDPLRHAPPTEKGIGATVLMCRLSKQRLGVGGEAEYLREMAHRRLAGVVPPIGVRAGRRCTKAA